MIFRHNLAALTLALVLIVPSAATAQGFRLSEPVETRDAPLEIISDQLEVDQNSGVTVFSGNVQATQGEMRLTSDELHVLTVEDEEGRSNIVQVRALGNVLLVTPTETAQADEMDYFIETEIVDARGNVVLVQGINTLTGQELTMNLATGEGRITGGVRTIIRFD